MRSGSARACSLPSSALVVPLRGTCRERGGMFRSIDPVPVCPGCGSVRVARSGGDDLVLESIRYRDTAAVERK